MIYRSWIIFIMFWSSLVFLKGQSQPIFIFPMKGDFPVSGNFGEIRSNHFHSGLDLATNGQKGFQVFAADNGYVSRIKISTVGYGTAVFIQHSNGYTTVYGHLDRLCNRIDSFAMANQYKNESFEIDYFPLPHEIPIKAHEVIGYSGNSGSSGGPHLHFEVRDSKSEQPVNPQFFIRKLEDNVPPGINGFRLYPLTDGSQINGRSQPVYYKAVKTASGYKSSELIQIKAGGKVGVGIETIDYTVLKGGRPIGVYSVELFVNNEQIFESQMDRFSFDQTRYINSFIDYAFLKTNKKTVQKSFIDPNNKLTLYNGVKNRGVIEIEDGQKYDFKYVVIDNQGNESILTFTIIGVPSSPKIEPIPAGYELVKWDDSHEYKSESCLFSINPATLYQDVKLKFSQLPKAPGTISSTYQLGNETISLQNSCQLKIKMPEGYSQLSDRIAIAQLINGKLVYVTSKVQFGWIGANVRELGKYALVVDTIKPTITAIKVPQNNNYKNTNKLEFKILDNFSGINSYRGEVDGKWILFEYDYKSSSLTCPLAKTLKSNSKEHNLKLIVSDGCGNSSTVNFRFVY